MAYYSENYAYIRILLVSLRLDWNGRFLDIDVVLSLGLRYGILTAGRHAGSNALVAALSKLGFHGKIDHRRGWMEFRFRRIPNLGHFDAFQIFHISSAKNLQSKRNCAFAFKIFAILFSSISDHRFKMC